VRKRLDSGVTWQTIDDYEHPTYDNPPSDKAVALDSAGTIYVAGYAIENRVTKSGKTTVTTKVNHWLIRKGISNANGSVSWQPTIDLPFPSSNDANRGTNVFPTGIVCVGTTVYVVGGGGSDGGNWQVIKSTNGGTTWSVVDDYRLDASGISGADAIAVDGAGNIYVAGTARKVVTAGRGNTATTTTTDYWIVRKGLPGGTGWATVDSFVYPGGYAVPASMAVDSSEQVYITGYARAGLLPARWITRHNSGTTWVTSDDFAYAANGGTQAYSICADPAGNLFATGGNFDSTNGNPQHWLVRKHAASADAWVQQAMQGYIPRGRNYHSTVWTGTEMILWGGVGPTNTGDRYNPATNTWAPVSTVGAPAPRYYHSAIWTGSEMIVWGGYPGHLNDGACYNPVTDTWRPVSTVGAPAGRRDHTAVWTGSEMIVWGGSSTNSTVGGRYNPVTDTWTPMSAVGAPAGREYHTAIWTGSEMIVWGGTLPYSNNGYTYLNDGGRYDPATDTWTPLNTIGAPAPRYAHNMVWTGSEMIVWGGHNATSHFGDGGRYDPATNGWSPVSTENSARARSYHSGVWTGSEIIVWGGYDGANDLNTGGRYDPVGNFWSELTLSGVPTPSQNRSHSAVWTGSKMNVWVNNGLNINYSYIPD
jgi:N-acetylneuraminic acid mutarotase